MRVIGIDPGTHRCGYSITESAGSKLKVHCCGVFNTQEKNKSMTAAERLYKIKQGLCELIEAYKPDALSMERLFINNNLKTAISVGEARGVIMLTAFERGLPIAEYTPQQIKSAITGSGSAAKDQVGRMVKVLTGLAEIPKPDDAADAVACAICHLQSAPFLKAAGKALMSA
jgi:crossover junction endodeoxyribonuclease RuvC